MPDSVMELQERMNTEKGEFVGRYKIILMLKQLLSDYNILRGLKHVEGKCMTSLAQKTGGYSDSRLDGVCNTLSLPLNAEIQLGKNA